LLERVLSGRKNAQIAGSTLLLKASLAGSVGLLAACGRLARPVADTGKIESAGRSRPFTDGFTESFDKPDLQGAKAPLEVVDA
jgi:hypothetical protein